MLEKRACRVLQSNLSCLASSCHFCYTYISVTLYICYTWGWTIDRKTVRRKFTRKGCCPAAAGGLIHNFGSLSGLVLQVYCWGPAVHFASLVPDLLFYSFQFCLKRCLNLLDKMRIYWGKGEPCRAAFLSVECRACCLSLKAVVFRSIDMELRKGLPSLH